ncbi:MAG: DUF6876 family protein [Sphingobacteriaceae bacterium]|jgi:hypothetical protein
MSKETPQEIERNLSYFTGTEEYHRFNGNILLTDGVKYMAEACQAFWFLDIIWSVLSTSKIINDYDRVFCKLEMTDEDTAIVTLDDGNKNILYFQRIDFTDFPLKEIKVFAFVNGEYRVLLLPSEY